jgi:Flp pilus assembly protein TadG
VKPGWRALIADRRGGTAAEFAMILPALLLLLLGIVESGRLIWSQSVLHFAVENAARCASVDATKCGSVSAVQNYAIDRASGLALTAAEVSVTTPACGSQVLATYPFQTVAGMLLPFSITLSAQSCFPK